MGNNYSDKFASLEDSLGVELEARYNLCSKGNSHLLPKDGLCHFCYSEIIKTPEADEIETALTDVPESNRLLRPIYDFLDEKRSGDQRFYHLITDRSRKEMLENAKRKLRLIQEHNLQHHNTTTYIF